MTVRRTMAATVIVLAAWAAGTATAQVTPSRAAFERTVALHGITFRVACANDSPRPTVTITPAKLAIDNSPMRDQVDGHVVDAEVADLNADGSPEIYVYVGQAGRRERRSVVAYSANQRKSLSAIYLPPVTDDPKAAIGYRGGDELAVVEGAFVRRFPVYRAGDADGKPTGGTRQIQYKLAHGEASWVFKADRVVEY